MATLITVLLRFVGYFCIAAGVGLGINRDIGSISSCALLYHDS